MFISDEQEAQTEAWELYYHLKSSEKDYLLKNQHEHEDNLL